MQQDQQDQPSPTPEPDPDQPQEEESDLSQMDTDELEALERQLRRQSRSPPPRRSGTRRLRPNSRYDPAIYQLGNIRNRRRSYIIPAVEKIVQEDDIMSMKLRDVDNPDTYQFKDAFNHPTEAPHWTQGIVDKLESIDENDVWELYDLKDQLKPVINCRWVFKKKIDAKGVVKRHKVRLVARGFTQRKGVNFNETFAPVAKFTSLRLLFALASDRNWHVHQMDAKTAFLCADIDQDDIFVQIPEGFELLGSNKIPSDMQKPVLRLKKGLYGLRQAPRLWYKKLTGHLREMGFRRSDLDHSVWAKDDIVVAIYVDDILVFGESQASIASTKQQLSDRFKMVDSGEVDYFLGLQVHRDKEGKFGLSQSHYVDRILAEFDMAEAAPADTPIVTLLRKRVPNSTHSIDEPTDIKRYQRAIGSLMYLMLATRPDLAFAVSHLSQFCSDPTKVHWSAVKRVFRYLKKTRDDVLWLNGTAAKPKTSELVYGFSDADWASDAQDRKSIGAYLYYYKGSVVSWASKKQACVATSSMESEYVSASTAAREGTWIREIVAEIDNIISKSYQKTPTAPPVLLLVDNQAAIRVAQNPEDHQRSKHIDVSYHYIRDKVDEGLMKLQYVPTKEMVADFLTKPLKPLTHNRCKFYTGLKPPQLSHRKRWV